LLKRRPVGDAALQEAYRKKLGCPNTGGFEPPPHSADLIRNRLIAGPRDLDAPH
jgi:hypothetical protein